MPYAPLCSLLRKGSSGFVAWGSRSYAWKPSERLRGRLAMLRVTLEGHADHRKTRRELNTANTATNQPKRKIPDPQGTFGLK